MNMRISGNGLATIRTSFANLKKPIPSTFQNYPHIEEDNTISYPTSNTLSSALQSYINSDSPSHGQKIHTHIIKSGLKPNTNISIKLLILHLKCGSLIYAHQLFDELPHRTLSAYNYMVSGYLKHGLVEESLSFVRRLVLAGERPDGYTFSMMLKASVFAGCSAPMLGKVAHARIMRLDIALDNVVCTALVDSYVKNGRVGSARKVFDAMFDRDMVCSTSMITGYMNQGSFEEAEEIFTKTIEKDVVVFNSMIEGYSHSIERAPRSLEIYVEMQRLGFRPNISTFASVIGACSVLAMYGVGQQIQSQLMKTEFFTHIKIGSAVINMYSKCGRVDDARRVFDRMAIKNVFSWTSMIDGYGKSGDPNEALELFKAMLKEGETKPNSVTFLSALSACGHAGMVEEGLEIFEMMERDYAMKPQMEHYSCLVDLLGRAGNLERAWGLVQEMPVKPNMDVWAALLSSCRLHNNVELANLAANELFKLNDEGRPGAYIALSNTLAAAGKWDSVSELRETMKVRGVSKGIGSSWVSGDCGLWHV